MYQENRNPPAGNNCWQSALAAQIRTTVKGIAIVLAFVFAYAHGGLLASAAESFEIPCSKITDLKSISSIKTEKIVITGTCHDPLDLSYLRTDSTLAFVAVKANKISLNNAQIGGSLEIQDSFIDTLTAVGAEITYDILIYSSVVTEPDYEGCKGFSLKNRLVFSSLDLRNVKSRSATFRGLEITEQMNLRSAHFSGLVNLHFSKATSVNMQHLEAEALDIHECEVDKLVIAQAKIERSLAVTCSHTNELELWLATVGQTINLQGTTLNKLEAFSLECGHLDLSTIQTEKDLTLLLSLSHVKVLTSVLRDGIVYKKFDAQGLVVDAFRTTSESGDVPTENDLRNFESFIAAGAKTDLTFPIRAAKVLASSGQVSSADRVLRYGSWLNVVRSYVGRAGSLLVIVPVLSILLAWVLLERSIRKQGTNSLNPSGPHTGVECFLLSIDLFLPNIVALGVQAKHEEYLKKLSWRGTSLIFLYRLFGWACVSSVLLWVSLRWSY